MSNTCEIYHENCEYRVSDSHGADKYDIGPPLEIDDAVLVVV